MLEGADRWGKPHVASLSFHSMLELRKCIENGKRHSFPSPVPLLKNYTKIFENNATRAVSSSLLFFLLLHTLFDMRYTMDNPGEL